MGRSSSSSQANQSTQNNYADNKVANESGIVVGNGSLDLSDRSTSNLDMSDRSVNTSNSWDASSTATGSYNNTYTTTADPEIARAAFDFAKGNDATVGATLANVLTFAKDITNKNADSATALAGRFSDGVAQAFDSARNTTAGGIDNKTMIVLGVAGAAALAVIASKRG